MPKQYRGPPLDSKLELHGKEEREYVLSLGNSEDNLALILETRIQARKYHAERQRQHSYYMKNRERKLQYQKERRVKLLQTETPAQKDARKVARRIAQEEYRELNREYLRAQRAERYSTKHKYKSGADPTVHCLAIFLMPLLRWPTTPLPPFERPSHWPSFIDHGNIYLTGEAEKEAILSVFDLDENTREDVQASLLDTYVAQRMEYRRRMDAIRPAMEAKFRSILFLHTKAVSRVLKRPITVSVLNRIRLAARERSELAIHRRLREEDLVARTQQGVQAARKVWVDVD
ncbi:hypothetical protein C8R42DRAFT_721676 [Lentinula raphanica]|nr:hypothetical protein C8R42DRAFT_721676 [Lentinula raphanica]